MKQFTFGSRTTVLFENVFKVKPGLPGNEMREKGIERNRYYFPIYFQLASFQFLFPSFALKPPFVGKKHPNENYFISIVILLQSRRKRLSSYFYHAIFLSSREHGILLLSFSFHDTFLLSLNTSLHKIDDLKKNSI